MKRFLLSLCILIEVLTNAGSQQIMQPSQLAIQNVIDICDILRISQIPVYISFSTDTACSTLINNVPTILYNPEFMNYIATAGQGGPIYVFAHEIGHIADLDLSWYGNFKHPWTKELQADYIGGYILGEMGFSLDEALNVHKYVLFTMYNTNNYPNSLIRMDAIRAGYLYAFE